MGQAQILKYTRANESEADRLGLAYLTKSGYDGRELVSFFQKMTRTVEFSTAFPSYLATHPGVPERIGYLQSLMADLPGSTSSGRSPVALRYVQLRLFILEVEPLEALEHFDSLLKSNPDNSNALFGRALAEKEMGRIDQSIEDLKKAHILNPKDPEILKELGLAFIRVGRINEGVRALEQALFLSGSDAETLHYLGQGYQAQKKLDPAIESYLGAKELNPDLPELYRDLGSAYKDKGEMGWSHFYYGLHFRNRKELDYARFHFEKAKELSSQDSHAQEEILRELEKLKQ